MRKYESMNSNIGQTNVIMTSNGWSPRSTSIYISSERTPLLGNRQDNHRRLTSAETTKVNVSVLLLGLILIGGASAGIYLLSQQNKEYMIHFPFDLIERKFWGASDFPGGPLLNHSFVTTIALFHTRGPMCYSMKTCSLVLREMQDMYTSTQNVDIPYNFLIGGDGKTYEAKGWMHQSGFVKLPSKNVTLTVALIGNFTNSNPLFCQLEEIKSFVSESIRRRKLSVNYVVKGVREKVGDGEAMFQFISNNWDRWHSTINVS